MEIIVSRILVQMEEFGMTLIDLANAQTIKFGPQELAYLLKLLALMEELGIQLFMLVFAQLELILMSINVIQSPDVLMAKLIIP